MNPRCYSLKGGVLQMTANRTKIVRVRLTPEEYESLEKKVQDSDFKDISKCMRALIDRKSVV